MSLRSRISTPEENAGRGEDGHLVASYRAKLLEEIDLAEMSSLAAAERRARLERVLGHIISREGPVLSTVERSQLIRRVVDSQGTPPTKVEADEYRTIDGLTIATRLTSYGPDGAVADRGVVTSFRCGPLDGTIFEPPKPH